MKSRLKAAWSYSSRVWTAYGKDSGGLMAAAIAFYALLSLVPLISLGAAVLGFVLGSSQEALRGIQMTISQGLPGNPDLQKILFDTLSHIKRDSGIAGLIGLVGLTLSASAIFTNIELAFNNMWKVRQMRAWWRQRLVAIGTMLLTILLLLSSLAMTSVLTWVQHRRVPGLEFHSAAISLLWKTLAHLLTLGISTLMFTLIYKTVPNCDVIWRRAAAGGIFAGIAWEGAKYLFALYVADYAHYDKIYGSLGAIISLMFWAYYSATILFLGAEIAAGRGHERPEQEPPATNIPHAQPREPEGRAHN